MEKAGKWKKLENGKSWKIEKAGRWKKLVKGRKWKKVENGKGKSWKRKNKCLTMRPENDRIPMTGKTRPADER